MRKRKIKLAVVAAHPPDARGEAHYSAQIYRRMARTFGDDISIQVFAHANGAPSQEDEPENLTVHRVTGGKSRSQRTASVGLMAEMVLREKPDIVHMQGTNTQHYGGIYGQPILNAVRRWKANGIPVALSLHSTWLHSNLDELWKKKRLPRFARRLMTVAYSSFLRRLTDDLDLTRIVVAGENVPVIPEYCAQHGLDESKISEESHACQPNPVSPDQQWAAAEKLGLKGERILFAGGFVRPDKGLHYLIEALPTVLQHNPSAYVVIAGEPTGEEGVEYSKELQALVEKLGLGDRVRLIFRFLTDEELSDYFDAASAIVIPYARAIGASGPIHHAIGRGKVVVASAVGQNIGLDGTIELFEPENADSLARVLGNVLADEDDSRRETVLEYARRHTWDLMAESYVSDYRRLIADRA